MNLKIIFVAITLITMLTFSPILSIKALRMSDASFTISSFSMSVQASLTRVPEEVYAWQPALIFAQVVGDFESIKLDVMVDVNLTINGNQPVNLPPYSTSFPLLPWSSSWYVTAIPGLPANTTDLLLGKKATISSAVSYKLIVDSVEKASGNYIVKQGIPQLKKPPIVVTMVYSALQDRKILEETMGLGPRGWVTGFGENVKALIVAFDDMGLDPDKVSFEYSISSEGWVKVAPNSDPLMGIVQRLVGDINQAIQIIKNYIQIWIPSFDLPQVYLPLSIYNATIPGQTVGNYVKFRANATDVDGNNFTSPMGFYYVVNKASGPRVLIVDPHVKLWLLQQNIEQMLNVLKQHSSYNLPADFTGNMTLTARISEALEKYGVVPFHHWELLGKYYNLYIAYPDERIVDLLKNQTEGGFEPHIITLSNLWLGLQNYEFWDWDLRDTVVDGKSVLEHVIQYVKQHHAGVVATHGTLSDWVVWLSCTNHYKVGSRGHVGDTIEDFDVMNETTLASLLGMPQLALWEFVRDEIAKILCANPQLQPLGCAVGSLPLQVPFIPLNQSFSATPEGANHPILQGLPEEFEVAIPSIYNEFGFKAYTQVGWQLAMPEALAYLAWHWANETRPLAERLVNKLTNLTENATNGNVLSENASRILDSLEWGLERLYKAIVSANISGTSFNMTLDLPNLGLMNLTRDIDYRKLLQLLPAKAVAVSKDWLAAIIAYDKYWDQNGYRAAYFSFEPEASNSSVAEKLLVNTVEWVRQWQYKPITEFLGNLLRVPKSLADAFDGTLNSLPGSIIWANGTVLVEEGRTMVEVNASQPGLLRLLIAHPTSNKVNVSAIRGANIYLITNVTEGLTYITLNVHRAGMVQVSIGADPDSSLNPAYITIKQEADTTPPSIWKVERLPEHPEYKESATVKANVTDQQSGVDVVILSYFNGSKWTNVTMTLESLYTAIIPALPYGTPVQYKLYGFDNIGNSRVTETYSYTVTDNTSPEVGVPTWFPEKPSPYQEVTINVSVTEPDYASGVKNVTLRFRIGGGGWQFREMTLTNGIWTAMIQGQSSDTTIDFYIEAYDNAGNHASTETYSYTVEAEAAPPSLPLEIPVGIGVTIAVLIGVVTYFVKFRKKKVG